MISRMVRAILLDVDLNEEVEHNQSLTAEALRVGDTGRSAGGHGTALSALFDGNLAGAVAGLFIRLAQVMLAWIIILSIPPAWLPK